MYGLSVRTVICSNNSELKRDCFLFIFRSPKLSLCNAAGISNEDLSELQKELQLMAADLVGEVGCLILSPA